MEQELPEISLAMMWPGEEMICVQVLQEVGLTRVMPLLRKPGDERGILNEGEGGDGVDFIVTICHHWRSPWRISYRIPCLNSPFTESREDDWECRNKNRHPGLLSQRREPQHLCPATCQRHELSSTWFSSCFG